MDALTDHMSPNSNQDFLNILGLNMQLQFVMAPHLEVALASLEIFSGEVILPSFTIASCAYAIQRESNPVFVDVDPKYFCLNPQKSKNILQIKLNASYS